MKKTTLKQPNGYQLAYYFDSRHFTVDGNPVEILASEKTGTEAEDVKHTLRKHTGEVVEHNMRLLIELYEAGRLV